MPSHDGIGFAIENGQLVLTRLDGFGTGHVQFTLTRTNGGISQEVSSGTIVVGSTPAVFDIPFFAPADSYEIRVNVDMAGEAVYTL